MTFPVIGFRCSFVVLTVNCFVVCTTFVLILFGGYGDIKHSPPIRIIVNSGSNDTECDWIKLLDPAEVPINQSIFFIETNSRATTHELKPRQACSVESAARISPDRLVFVLFLREQFECKNYTKAMVSLQSYTNIRFRHIDLFTYVYGTLFEDFILSGIMKKGKWKIEQHSDMLRLLTLWKFGGIYMDLDVVSLRPLPLINFIGSEYPEKLLTSAVIGMQSRSIAKEAIHMFINGWDGDVWIKNGPLLFTNLMKKYCKTEDVPSMYSANCGKFTVYPPEVFGPIAWYEWNILFNSSQIEFVERKLKKTMAVNFWNKMTKGTSIYHKDFVPYTYIASKNCPKVFGTIVDYF